MRLVLALFAGVFAAPAAVAAPVDFRTQVYPVLHDRCFRCHQGADAKSGIRLDQRTEVLKRVRPGRSGDSLLVTAVTSADPDTRMPPSGPRLTAAEVQVLKDWINEGVKWDDTLLPPDAAKANHWAFRPVTRPAVPAGTGRNPVDVFVAATHTARGLRPAPEADRRVLLRRLAFDLTGLPPTPEEVEAFVADPAPDAYGKQVDRLLASPAYGERWGRHWLDVARYADSEGYESDHPRPYAWRYRDWVVAAFNADEPYDRFVRAQVAGDEVEPYRDANLIATGFLAAARLSGNEEDAARQMNDVYVDVANTTAAAFLGLTLNCAQCHAHKFDPITDRDYYRFQGFFLKGMPNNLALRDPAGRAARAAAEPPEYAPAKALLRATLDAARAKLIARARASLTPAQLVAHDTPADLRTPEQHATAVVAALKFQFNAGQIDATIPPEDRALVAELKKKVAAVETTLPDVPQTWGFYSPATSPHRVEVLPMRGFYPPVYDPFALARARPFVQLAGDAHRRGVAVEPGWPEVFGPTPPSAQARPRTALADWLTDPRNPLTARVWANRVWHYHFGRGLVETGGDFGVRGSPPSHPELLDWLAAELMSPTWVPPNGRPGGRWSTKHLHRLIVHSAAYRQASRGDAASVARDPDNRYLTRWKPRRAEAEAVRDAMLLVAGELDRTVGGRPDGDEILSPRRGLYLLQKRQRPPTVQMLFDGPTGATESCPRRVPSETPLSALFLLNNPFTADRAASLAARVRRVAGADRDRQGEVVFRLALGRLPTADERRAVAGYFAAADAADPLTWLCQTVLALNEFTTIE